MNYCLGFAGLFIAASLLAQSPAPPERGAFTGTMPPGDGGPRNHRILLASSADGLKWTVANESLAEQASVPELFAGPDGKLIALYVDASGQAQRGALGAMVRGEDGKWTRVETNLRGADPNIVRLKDGSYRGYTKERDGAIIVFSSRDGLDWERVGVAFQDERYRNTTDSDVFETPDGWVVLISLGPRMLRCTSIDGLKFTTDDTILELGGSVSDTVKVAGGWRTFFHVNGNRSTGSKMIIRSAFTADGKSWKVEEGDRIVAPSSGPASLGVADPAPVQLKDGSWLMAVKSFIEAPQFGRGTDFSQRTGSQTSGRAFPPLQAGAGRGEGERRSQNSQVPNDFTVKPPPQDFANANGPWNNDVVAWRASASGEVTKAATFERAGVPTIARLKDGRLIVAHQHFPENDRESFDKVAVHFSSDDGTTWGEAQVIQVAGLPEGMRFPFDPTLVPLPDGRVRLYFTGNMRRAASTPAIHSAISTDGVNYTYEPGVRFAVEGRAVIDCAVALHNGVFHLYAPDNGAGANPGAPRDNRAAADRPRDGVGYHATSKDGLNFTRVDDVTMTGNNRWLGNAQSDGGKIAFFGSGPGPWPLTSSDGATWTASTSRWRLPGADPGAVKLKNGDWLVVATGPPVRRATPNRADAPAGGARREQKFQPQAPPLRRIAPQGRANPENDFEPPVGLDPNVEREAPGRFRLMSARSRDGLTFVPTGEVISDQANVPDLILNDRGEIHLYYTGGQVGDRQNTLGLAISGDQGKSWRFKHVEVPGFERAGDPDIVRLPDGTWRMFLTTRVNNNIGIIYADSRDGIRFEHRGTAFAQTGLDLLDSTTFQIGSTWHTLTLQGREARQRHGTSPDAAVFGVGDIMPFVADDEPCIAANGVAVDGGYRMYGFSPRARNFRSFFSKDGTQWTAEPGVRLAFDEVSSGGGTQIKDPSVLKLADGSYLMVYTARIPETRGENVSDAARREQPGQRGTGGQIRVEKIDSKYKVAPGAKPGSFVSGQDADIVLGSKGFNNSGGALLFNHPTGLATDGKALLMTDRWNNRVLIWKSAPAKNTPPDLVLGQPDFTQNNPGTGKHQLNWPGNVAISPDGKRIAVTDTSNDRILIWNSFPTKNGQAADLVLDLPQLSGGAPASGPADAREGAERRFPNRPGGEGEQRGQDLQSPPRTERQRAELEFRAPPEGGALGSNFRPQVGRGIQRFSWPWGVWTDGTKLAVVATHGSAVLIWNSLPTRNNQPPDLVLRPDDAGTPRNVTSDGKTFFAVSDHNNRAASRPATMIWNSFPTSATQAPDWRWSEWVKGSFTPGGGLVVAGMQSIYLFNKAPRDAEVDADVVLRPATYRNGDGPDAVVANGRLYVCTYNGNHILGWNALPTRDNQPADFALGSERTDQDTWAENFFIQNAVVATDGKSLFVTSDFDRKMFVWRNLPDESAVKPDLVMHLPDGPWDNELHGSTLALAGRSSVSIWKKLPLNGESPDIVLRGRIGSVELGELTGVAFDDKYFYLSDRRSESIYVWRGIPDQDDEPAFTLSMRSPGRLTSDGNYLCAAPFEGNGIQLWRVSDFASGAGVSPASRTQRAEERGREEQRTGGTPVPLTLGGRGQFNLPSECLIADGRLFVCNRSFNRVDVWNRVEDALAGRPADALLGATDAQDRQPGIGRNKLFMPGSLAWGGGYLWVGEFKFSTRILRFSPRGAEPASGE